MSEQNGKEIIKVKKEKGVIKEVMFNDNSTVTIDEAIQMAERNEIIGVHTGITRGDNPHKTLIGNPDGDPSNNLDNLPSFE